VTSSIVVVTPPATEPISLGDAKNFLKVDYPDDDALIETFITAARMRVEVAAYTKLITQTLALTLDYFPWGRTSSYWNGYGQRWATDPWPVIELEPPAQSITSVTYLDPSGALQTLDPSVYRLDANSKPARLTPALNQVWPATAQEIAAVVVTYVAGFGTAAQVPDDLIQAVRLLIDHYYENRAQVMVGTRVVAIEIPEGFDDLVRNYTPPMVA
jgi:uncharacterized phiE125 gp8 family phage protein